MYDIKIVVLWTDVISLFEDLGILLFVGFSKIITKINDTLAAMKQAILLYFQQVTKLAAPYRVIFSRRLAKREIVRLK